MYLFSVMFCITMLLHKMVSSKRRVCFSVTVKLTLVGDRNHQNCTDLSLSSSLFVSCDQSCGFVSSVFLSPPFISATFPVHHMNVASHSELVFPGSIWFKNFVLKYILSRSKGKVVCNALNKHNMFV